MGLQTNQELIWPLEAFNPREDAHGTNEVKTNGAVVASVSCPVWIASLLQVCLLPVGSLSMSRTRWFGQDHESKHQESLLWPQNIP